MVKTLGGTPVRCSLNGLCPAQVAETLASLFFPFLHGIHLPHDVQRFVSPLECDMHEFIPNNDKLSSPLNPLSLKTHLDNGYCVLHRPLLSCVGAEALLFGMNGKTR